MFDTRKFGAYLSRLRKNADMTQSELADKLNLSRQAVSKYEGGESFPDISILIRIAEQFGTSLDVLVGSGEPTKGEAALFENAAQSSPDIADAQTADIVNLAPLLKPSVLNRMATGLAKQGIDISSVVTLAEYLNDDSVLKLLETATFDTLNEELLQKLIPFLDEESKIIIFDKILEGELDYHLIKLMLPYMDYLRSYVECAVAYGAMDWDALKVMRPE